MEKVKLNIYLIRHGEKTPDGKSLSKKGEKQIKLLAKRLKKLKIDKIYSSDLERCKITTDSINNSLKLNVIFDKNLREVDGEVKENPSKYPKKINKIKKFWENLTKEKGNILVVGSGNVNRILLAIIIGISPSESRFVQIPSGVTHLEFIKKGKTRLVYVNDTSHLPDSLKKRQAY